MTISAPTSIGTNTGTGVNTVAVTVGVGGVPAGALIVVGVYETSTAIPGLSACTDTAGNTYNRTSSVIGGTNVLSTYYAWSNGSGATLALTNGNTITATLAQTGKNAAISAFYCVGVQNSSDPRDINVATTTSTSTAPSAGPSAAPAANNELFVGFVGVTGTSADTFTQDSTNAAYTNFPIRVGIAGAGGPTIAGGAFIQGTAAALSYAPTLGTSRLWGARLWSFKASGAVVNQKAISITQGETVSLARGTLKIVAIAQGQNIAIKRAINKTVAVLSGETVLLNRAIRKLIAALSGETVSLVISNSRSKLITILSPETVSLIARFAKLQLIQVAQAQSIALIRNLKKLVQVTQAQLVRVVKSDAKSINILSGESVSVIPLRNKVVVLTQGELITQIRGVSKRIQLRNLQLLHVTRNLMHRITILQAQTVRLARRTGKIIQLYMGQIVIAAAHGFTPDSPLQVLKNSIERVRALNNQIQRIRALKNSIKRRP